MSNDARYTVEKVAVTRVAPEKIDETLKSGTIGMQLSLPCPI
jgi:hypothetical protein